MRPSVRPVLLLPILACLLLVGGYAAHRGLPPGRARTYYVAADEVAWDYAPSGSDQIKDRPFDDTQRPFVEAGPHSVGHVAMKAVYREYTDSTFKTLKSRPAAWQHLGLLGPVLRAEVGDTIRVVFRNNTRFAVSMHPHGVLYGKDSEGASYSDNTQSADKDGVPSGGVHLYVWPVPERAGPGGGDPSSILWMYHSHVHEDQDISSGLMGPMIVSARGTTKADGTPKDVDREFVVAFYEVDENASRYLQNNIQTYMKDPAGVHVENVFGVQQVVPPPEGQFNFKETLNGFVYGNGPMPQMRVGDRVRWYLMSATGFEIHSPHWHGNTVEIAHSRTDVAGLLPMGMIVADMVPDNPGIWLFHCHVSNHLKMGMQMRYEVAAK
ncbi:MAG TPA: multicopper oxidase domain-containing protein [Gemmatimonadales bacterium]|nr:multicopper oxidase domain-containing protein [Gemmatimonadales bacterium]